VQSTEAVGGEAPSAHRDRRRPSGVLLPGRREGGTRSEIQALRAIAVAMVVVYHLRPSALPGGYVGVDVFFVISGFLISRHLAREADATGRIDLAAFWAGRVRRILPAALVTVVAVVAATTLIQPRTAAAEVGRTSWWATLSAANWLFATHAVDYQAQTPDASPFEHFWSLGVEEQFYLAWPLLVLATAMLAGRRARSTRSLVLVPFTAVLVLSLAFGVWFTSTGSPAAYFVTPTRMWELAGGGVLAVLLGDRRLRVPVAATLQLGGVAAIALAAVALDSRTPMPGIAALLPVAGAAAFIAGGAVPGLDRAWSIRPVRVLGDLSYSLYLWHWPVIVLVRDLTGRPLDPMEVVAVVAGSLLLAVASYRLVERPLRRVRIRRPLRVLAVGAVAVVVVVGVGVVPVARDAAVTADEASARRLVLRQVTGPALGYPNLDAAADQAWVRPEHVVVPDPAALAKDLSLPQCASGAGASTTVVCVRGDLASSTTVALVGDSHLRQWATVLDGIARRQHWRVVMLLHNSCPFNLVPRSMELAGTSHCTQAVRRTLPVLRAQHVRVIVTSAYRGSYARRELPRAAAGYASMWRSLQRSGFPVIALGDTPTPSAHPLTVDCIAAQDAAGCGVLRAEALATPDPLAVAARSTPGVPFLDPVDAFCGTTWCPGVIGNVGVWVDDNHASRTYLQTTEPWLQQHLVPLIEQALTGR
jgi:peptidoglycan/LPS O-acetylase OafA/YrhL